MTAVAALSLSPLDVACGLALDPRPQPRPPALPATTSTPERALLDAVRPALRRPPCLVSFSGGRDSSLVLAAAVRVAREEGLAPPIPVTNRFPGAPDADESRWQEQVIAQLGLADWRRLELDDELDAVGPYARRMLREHGLLWPFNVHFHLPLLDLARGGSLLTGLGGDQLLDVLRPPRQRTRARRLAHAALVRAPRPVRAAVIAARDPLQAPWMRPAAARAATRAMAAQLSARPRAPLAARMEYELSLRYLRVTRQSLAVCAAAGDVLLAHPLCAPQLWSAVARACAPRDGFPGDERALRALFGALLPDGLAARTDKASFDAVFYNRHGRAFARGWDGGGVPHELVDAEALRGGWLSDAPPCLSLTLMQAAWLSAYPTLDHRPAHEPELGHTV
ncbi:MAG TPA: asparagine synthase-related protein [Solirubrobacteraceae bacterium]|nr:asparagine synthase-related protein [Solirubrobacteraceae bacterium]